MSKLFAQNDPQVIKKDLTIVGDSLNSDLIKLDINQKDYVKKSLQENYLQDNMDFSKRISSLLDSHDIFDDIENTEFSIKDFSKH